MIKIYEVEIISLGEDSGTMLENNIITLFAEEAPSELAKVSVVNEKSELKGKVEKGDIISIDNQNYEITAVGEIANNNIRKLGHVTLRFNGKTTTKLPGDINLEKSEPPDLHEGTTISILKEFKNIL